MDFALHIVPLYARLLVLILGVDTMLEPRVRLISSCDIATRPLNKAWAVIG